MGEQSPESAIAKKQGYLAIESWGYKGIALDFMGVHHDPVTFESYRERLEQQISKNDVILLEAAPRAEGLMDASGGISESIIAEMQRTYKVPATEIRKMMGRLKPALDFFAEMERLAGEAGKDVMVFDPYSADPATTEAKEEMKKVGLQLYAVRAAGLMGLPLSGILGGASLAVSEAKKGHSRRAFLAGSLATVAGLAMATSVAGTYHDSTRFSSRAAVEKPNPVTLTLADVDDYRDVAVTHVFTKLADSGQLDSKVGAIYGEGHRAQMRYYTQSPWQADLKLSTVYSGLAEISPPRYRRFAYRGGNTWAKTQDRIIK